MRVRRNIIKIFIFGVTFLVLSFGPASASRAEEKEEGMYFSILGVENSIGGDFNGNKWYQNKELTITNYVPDIESAQGFGILIGGYNDKMAGEISYLRSVHDTTHWKGSYDGEVELINLDLKLYAIKLFDQRIRTYFLFGFFSPIITIDNAGDDGTNLGDAIYRGYGLNLGLGAEIRPHRKVGIEGSLVFRGLKINRIDVLGTELEPTDNFLATGRSYSIRVNYYF